MSPGGVALLLAYVACVPLSNWMIGHAGVLCLPDGPCLVPVAPHIMAPSGVLVASLALILRDLVQRKLGIAWSLAAIATGSTLSAIFAPPSLVLASTTAFAFSETLDLAIFTPLRRRGLMLAVFASVTVALVADSVIFLLLAFGNLDLLAGQALGKFWVLLAAMPVMAWLQRRGTSPGRR